jgi:hypothetical protein
MKKREKKNKEREYKRPEVKRHGNLRLMTQCSGPRCW